MNLYANDIIEIDNENGFPNFNILNREVKPFDLNLEHQLNLSFPIDNFVFFQNKNTSFFSVNKLKISNKNNPLILDDIIEIKTPAEITVIPGKLNVVVGKDRSFE